MKKGIVFGTEARKHFRDAADYLAAPVAVTLGPLGKNVIYGRKLQAARSTKDGVTVAGEVEHDNPFVNCCIQVCRQAALKTVESAGDGTTTATILARALIHEIELQLSEGKSILDIKEQLRSGLSLCSEEISRIAIPLVNKSGELDLDKIQQVAAISANNDNSIGQLFKEAYSVIGKNGVVLLEESHSAHTYVSSVPGMRQERGMSSPYFMTKPDKCEYDQPVFFITDKILTQLKDVLKVCEVALSMNRPLIIFCNDLQGEALGFVVRNKMQNSFMVSAVSYPGWYKDGAEILKDIAAYTGATYCSEEKGINVDNLAPEEIAKLLGSAGKFTASMKDCVIVNADGDSEDVENRVKELEKRITPEVSPVEEETLRSRISKLTGGVAILYAGGTTEVERKETKDRCDDAVKAVRSALEQGYVPGGGTTHLRCSQILPKGSILKNPLFEITAQICRNAHVEPSEVIDNVLQRSTYEGYNAIRGGVENLLESGVVDSAKVVRSSLEAAVSIAMTYLSTDSIVVEMGEN